jgi:hypothetical protein
MHHLEVHIPELNLSRNARTTEVRKEAPSVSSATRTKLRFIPQPPATSQLAGNVRTLSGNAPRKRMQCRETRRF